MTAALLNYLNRVVRAELKWMYHYDTDDRLFGVPTDKYRWCKEVIEGNRNIHELIEYFQKHYRSEESAFIKHIQELIR